MDSLLTPKQVAGLLNCKASSVYSWAKSGQIPAFKLNGLLRFDKDEIEAWIKSNRIEPEIVSSPRSRPLKDRDIDSIVKSAIASAKGSGYNVSRLGKPDQSGPERGC